MPIDAVIFDLYGTLVSKDKRLDPYKRITGRIGKDVTDLIMRQRGGIRDFIRLGKTEIDEEEILMLESMEKEEIASVSLFPDTITTLASLKENGIRIGICSNLAESYSSVSGLFPKGIVDAFVFSFETGYVKPEHAIYRNAIDAIGGRAKNTLFVGDTPKADFYGPREVGMESVLIDRTGRHDGKNMEIIHGLGEVWKYFPLKNKKLLTSSKTQR